MNTFKQGDLIFYVPKTAAATSLARSGRLGTMSGVDLPESIKRDPEAGRGIKLRGVVDRVLSDKLRLTLSETYDTVLADYDEVEPLDVVTQIGDSLNSKTIEEQLADAKDYETKGPDSILSRNTPFKRSKARIVVRCVICKDRQESGAVVYKPVKGGAGCGWTMSARFCLRCVLEERAPLTRPSA